MCHPKKDLLTESCFRIRTTRWTYILRLSLRSILEIVRLLEEEDSNRSMMVIALDEAQGLAAGQGFGVEQYRPLDALYQLVNEYSHSRCEDYAVWVVLASTASGIADFTPPKIRECDISVVSVGLASYTSVQKYLQVGWDHNAIDLGEASVRGYLQTSPHLGLWTALMAVHECTCGTVHDGRNCFLETMWKETLRPNGNQTRTGSVVSAIHDRTRIPPACGTGVDNHLYIALGDVPGGNTERRSFVANGAVSIHKACWESSLVRGKRVEMKFT
ncbi:hypothetical protein JVT61DRAFT_8568 [Boletus reticuloceps]|uniref:Uncharacterized protein n=1 Tax=Boletus reticuloceps TaxID=495285 RepID=A0A8I2Z0I9_9AGAM|nr:hypothetical protein JVT61DRAFT_8568 [Boletus reticuloceps]